MNWLPVILCGSLIFYLSSKPVTSPIEIKHIDLVAHTGFYMLLALLAARAIRLNNKTNRIKYALLLIVFVAAYGLAIEIYQSFVPTRSPSILDGIANLTGAFLGVIFYALFPHLIKERVRRNHDS